MLWPLLIIIYPALLRAPPFPELGLIPTPEGLEPLGG